MLSLPLRFITISMCSHRLSLLSEQSPPRLVRKLRPLADSGQKHQVTWIDLPKCSAPMWNIRDNLPNSVYASCVHHMEKLRCCIGCRPISRHSPSWSLHQADRWTEEGPPVQRHAINIENHNTKEHMYQEDGTLESVETSIEFEDFRNYASSKFAVTISRVQQAALERACGRVPLPAKQLELANAKREKEPRMYHGNKLVIHFEFALITVSPVCHILTGQLDA